MNNEPKTFENEEEMYRYEAAQFQKEHMLGYERTSLNRCLFCNAVFPVYEADKDEEMVCSQECLDEIRFNEQ